MIDRFEFWFNIIEPNEPDQPLSDNSVSCGLRIGGPEMRLLSQMLALALLSPLIGGCGTSTTVPLTDGGSSADPAAERGNGGLLSISVDGKASEWQGVDPVWEEGGAAGPGDFPGSIDIQQVYFSNDQDLLHVFLRVSPTVQERFADRGSSGELCDIFFDTDNDQATGCKDVDGFDYGKINGYEFRLWVPLGVQSSSEASQPFVSYELQPVDTSGQFQVRCCRRFSVARAERADSAWR